MFATITSDTISITTRAKDGTTPTFTVTVEELRNAKGDVRWHYTIASWSREADFFQARFKAVDGNGLRLMAIDHNFVPEFMSKGIPEEIFEDVTRRTGRTLFSNVTEGENDSTPYGGDDDTVERRSPEATKMWERLERIDRAQRVPGEDRFVFRPMKP